MTNEHTETTIRDVLCGDTLENALDFLAFLRANEMNAGGEHGSVSYKGECVAYMHLDDSEQMPGPWTIWTEGDYSRERADVPMSGQMKQIAWNHVNFCTSCGCGSQPGQRKTILGREFEHVCNADMAFYLPDAQALACVKQLLTMRKNLIDE